MSNRSWSALLAALVGAVLLSLASMSAAAQNEAKTQAQTQPLHFDPIPNARALCPKEADADRTLKDRLLALPANVVEPPKTPEGWPDLQGSWNSDAYPGRVGHSMEVGVDPLDIAIQCQPQDKLEVLRQDLLIDPMRGRIPYQPWAKAKQMEFLAGEYAPVKRMDVDPAVLCFPTGVPHSVLAGVIELRYVPGAIVFLTNKATRIIPMDGAAHVNDGMKLFMGDPRGHWEGHTLVIETTNNRDGTWFDKHGTFHSETLRVIERLTMVSPNTLYYEVTIIDPTVFTQTWKAAQTFDRKKISRVTDLEGHEDSCHESDTSTERAVRAGLRARAAGIHGYHIHVDLKTGKAVSPEDQKYLEESGQPLGYSFAPGIPDDALPKAKDGSAAH